MIKMQTQQIYSEQAGPIEFEVNTAAPYLKKSMQLLLLLNGSKLAHVINI